MNTNTTNIGIIGGGSWATAMVKILCERPQKIHWYMRSSYVKEHIEHQRHNPNYLGAVELYTEQLEITNDINEVVDKSDVLIFAIPSAFIHQELKKLTASIKSKLVFSAIKGIIPETGHIITSYFNEQYNIPYDHVGVITGPCHAEEVALERLSYLTIACVKKKNAELLANAMSSDYIKVKLSKDVIGLEYASVLKNIYAIVAGICHGLGYGDNFQSVLMSNSIREMSRFIKNVDKGKKRNINNSAYLGDLLVTGYSVFSRNRMFGNMIGKGYTVKSAMMEMIMVVEGYYATKSAYSLFQDQNKDKFPIIHSIYQILYNHKNPKKIIKEMTERIN